MEDSQPVGRGPWGFPRMGSMWRGGGVSSHELTHNKVWWLEDMVFLVTAVTRGLLGETITNPGHLATPACPDGEGAVYVKSNKV